MMAATADRHSRLVARLKILLPLLALAILSTLFLVSRRTDPGQQIPYADVDPEGVEHGEKVGAPRFAGVARDGSAVSLEAASARPGATMVSLVAPRARIDLPDGRSITVVAASGSFDQEQQRGELQGHVVVTGSGGYRLQSDRIDADLGDGTLVSPGPVDGTMPFGALRAGAMALRPGAAGGRVLSFDGGVRLVYRPQQ